MRHGSLFSGIGGFDLASEWMGWTNVFHCEINEFCRKVLKQHFPNAATYTDITTTDFSEWQGMCDIVTGGFPCQPYSQAGKRKGKADDRHLWPEMLRAIREIQPIWVVGENVPGLLNWERGMVLAEIYADLEAAGFEVFSPIILPAGGIGADHKRHRMFLVAHSTSKGLQSLHEQHTEKYQINPKVSNFISSDTTIGRLFRQGNYREIRRGYGVPDRVDRIKALGNAIVPQVAYEIFKAIEEINEKI